MSKRDIRRESQVQLVVSTANERTPLRSDDAVESWPPDRTASPKRGAEAQNMLNQMTEPVPDAGSEKLPRPWFSYFMVLSCLAGLIYTLVKQQGIAPLDVNPMIGPSALVLLNSGAKYTPYILQKGEWWRLITPMWLHAGVVHLFTNLNMLVRMGFALERGIGTLRYATIYLLASVISMAYSAVFASQAITVGASGALFGVLGALLGEMSQNCHLLSVKDRCCGFFTLLLTIAINLAVGLLPFVDNFAHFFGCLSGLLLGMVLVLHRDRRGFLKFRQVCTAVFSAALFIFFAVIPFILLGYELDADQFCPWCKYISCVPAPWWSCDMQPISSSTANTTVPLL